MTKLKEYAAFIGLGFITAGLILSGLLMIAYSAFMTVFVFVLVSSLGLLGSVITLVIIGCYALYRKLLRK